MITKIKSRTEIILIVLKYLALLGGIGFSIECGAELLSLVAGILNPAWSIHVYKFDPDWLHIRENNAGLYVCGMVLIIAISALKGTIWYLIFNLLEKFQLQSPFSMKVTKQLEKISFLLLGTWFLMGFIGKTYSYYLIKSTGLTMPGQNMGDDYFFVAGIVYIISQIFKRGIEMQEENSLTV